MSFILRQIRFFIIIFFHFPSRVGYLQLVSRPFNCYSNISLSPLHLSTLILKCVIINILEFNMKHLFKFKRFMYVFVDGSLNGYMNGLSRWVEDGEWIKRMHEKRFDICPCSRCSCLYFFILRRGRMSPICYDGMKWEGKCMFIYRKWKKNQ